MIAQLFAFFFPHIPPSRASPHSHPGRPSWYVQVRSEDRSAWRDGRTYHREYLFDPGPVCHRYTTGAARVYTATTHTRALYVHRTLCTSPLQTEDGIPSHGLVSVSIPLHRHAESERRPILWSVSATRDRVWIGSTGLDAVARLEPRQVPRFSGHRSATVSPPVGRSR